MAEKESERVKCPVCSSPAGRAVNEHAVFRPRSQTGNLKTDLTPVSITLTYRCQDQACGHEWNAITPA
jgi:hypothetical protein